MKARITYSRFAPARYELDGKEVSQEEYESANPSVGIDEEGSVPCTGNWKTPVLSDALAVHPDQIPEVMERNKRHGVYVEYEKQFGRPILKDSGAKRALMRIEGLHDRNTFC